MSERRKQEEDALVRMAEAITDGVPVDWKRERVAHRDLAPQVDHLRQIEDVARAYRRESSGAKENTGHESPGDTPNASWRMLKTSTFKPIDSPPGDGGNLVWGPLIVLEKIGEGSFAEVYRAYDPALKLEVALKLRRGQVSQDDPLVERFLDEARRLASVRHVHIVAVHGADLHDGRVGLWTDLVRGETLEQAVKERGFFGAHEAACIGVDLCCALSSLHAHGLVHRDIKPSNVMREQGGNIVLMDFGSAVELVDPQGRRERLNGTPLTTAPEVLLHGEPPQPTADIYGLGVLLYWLVSGRYPVDARDMTELIQKHQHGESVPLLDARPDLPMAFAQVVERAIAQDPAQRFATPGEMQRALCAALGAAASLQASKPTEGTQGQPASAPVQGDAERRRQRQRWLAASVAAGVLAVGAYAVPRHVVPAVFQTRSLQAQATLFRVGETGEERLSPGAHVRVGDGLFVEIQGSQRMYVYILNADEHGEAWVLMDPQNPLAADVKHRLPGAEDGVERCWGVSSAGGKETILVIASRKLLPQLNQMLATWPRVNRGTLASSRGSGTVAADRPRGIGVEEEMAAPLPRTLGDSLLPNVIQVLLSDESKSRGIWFWQIHLVNDGT